MKRSLTRFYEKLQVLIPATDCLRSGLNHLASQSIGSKSIRNQLIWSCVAIVSAALLLSFIAFSVSQTIAARKNLCESLEITARIAGNEAAAALEFYEPLSAKEIVDGLGNIPHLREAVILNAEGEEFVSFQRDSDVEPRVEPLSIGAIEFSSNTLELREPITADGLPIGSIYLNSSLKPMYDELSRSIWTAAVINVFCLLCSLLLLKRVLNLLSNPVTALSKVTTEVAEDQDYSRRVNVEAENELGELAASFNHMLSTIQNQQERLKAAERMQSIGVMAGGVAHDLNNILGPVVGYPGLILEDMADDDPNRAYVQIIQECAIKAGGVLQGLLSLARRGNYSTEPLDLNRLLQDLPENVGLRHRLAKYPQTKLKIDLEPGLSPIRGASPQLIQVFLNLTINALEAMGDVGGTLTVSSRHYMKGIGDSEYKRVPPGNYIEVTVSDEGSGIAPDRLNEIFEPFKSSKPMAESGTGLGLAVVASVVHDHHGFVDVESKVGHGATFRVFLPVDESSVLASFEEGVIKGNDERLLIVDDFKPQRVMTAEVVMNLGYRAECASSGREAAMRIRQSQFDLVILDMKMEEDFDGLDTYEAILQIDPDLPCVIVTGDADSARVKRALELGVFDCIAKPFSTEHLSRQIHEALMQRPESVAA